MPKWKSYDLSPARDAGIEAAINGLGWYATPIPRSELKKFIARSDALAARHFLIWAVALMASGTMLVATWGSWWLVLALPLYGVIYNSADSKWHELSHGTPFRTAWLNEALYRFVAFMTLREPIRWRWSHARHHTHTILVGHDPEIASPRPPSFWKAIVGLWYLRGLQTEIARVSRIALGRIPAEVASFVPEAQRAPMVASSRMFLAYLAAIAGACLATTSILPAMLVGLPRLYGSFLHYTMAFTQHAGLEEDVLDHRLNARTVILNPAFAFLYTNMNYHVEHHMFPMVPFYRLPALHRRITQDCPTPMQGLWRAYAEIIGTLRRQKRDPEHWAGRSLPEGAGSPRPLPAALPARSELAA